MSSSATNPGTLFGGTWEQITDRMIMAAGSSYKAGTTGGAASHTHTSAAHTHTTAGHTLTVAETPAHTHTRGTMNITGRVAPAHSSGACWYNVAGAKGAFYSYENVRNNGIPALNNTFSGDHMLGFDASRSWTGETSSVGGGSSHSHGDTGSTTPGNTGSSSNLPPYIVAYIWRRTA